MYASTRGPRIVGRRRLAPPPSLSRAAAAACTLQRLFKELFYRKGFQYDNMFDWTVLNLQQERNRTGPGPERPLRIESTGADGQQRDTRGDYGDGVEHASEGEQHDAAAHLEHASEGEQHDAAAHPDEPRSDECIEERAQE